MYVHIQEAGVVGLTSTTFFAAFAVIALVEAQDRLRPFEQVKQAMGEALDYSSNCYDCDDIALCCLVG